MCRLLPVDVHDGKWEMKCSVLMDRPWRGRGAGSGYQGAAGSTEVDLLVVLFWLVKKKK